MLQNGRAMKKSRASVKQGRETVPLIRPAGKSWRRYAVFGLLVAFIVSAYFALTQNPFPDPDSAPQGFAFLRYPIERNSFKRLPSIGADINDLHVHPDGRQIWAVGQSGLILHSRDGGLCWEPQIFPGGPDFSEEALHRCRNHWRPAFPAIVPNAGAAVQKEVPVNLEQQSPAQNQKNITPAQQVQQRPVEKQVPQPSPAPVKSAPDQTTAQATQPVPENTGGMDLNAVYFTDDVHGWAAGQTGILLTTSDGGTTWQHQVSGTDMSLHAIHFVDGLHGWAVGDGGTILATLDGGNTWQQQDGTTVVALLSVYFVDEMHGWVVGAGGMILATRDGGNSWEWQRSGVFYKSGVYKSLNSVYFVDNEHGWVVGSDGMILATSDGGNSWEPQESITKDALSSVYFHDGEQGWAVGSGGTILTTSDGGSNWRKQNNIKGTMLQAVSFIDGERGWAVGSFGTIWATRDGGSGWQRQSSGKKAAGTGDTIPSTTDGGLTWKQSAYRRYPAPWFLGVTTLILLTGLLVLRPPKPRQLKPTIADMLASDRPLRPGDLQNGQDALGIGNLAEDLSYFLRNPSTAAPLTIAVTGEWGSGKSSLMGLLQEDLKHHGFRPVWFNAWHHQKGEQLLASLFAHIKEQAIPGWLHRGGRAYRFRLAVSRGRRQWPLYAIVLIVFIASTVFNSDKIGVIATNLLKLVFHPEVWWDAYGGWLGNFLLQPFKVVEGVTGQEWLSLLAALFGLGGPLAAFIRASKGFGLNPARLVTVNPADRGTRGLDPGARARFTREFQDVTRCLGRKMVIFIDDLDRCSKDNLVEVLENVNLLASSGDCFIVLGMSPEWVESCIALQYEQLAEELANERPANGDPKEHKRRFARNYLEKMINIEVPIPRLDRTAAAMMLQGGEGGAKTKPSEWAVTLVPYLLFAAVILYYGVWYGLSIPQPPAVIKPDRLRSWPLDEMRVKEIKPGEPLLELLTSQDSRLQETEGQGATPLAEKLEVTLQGRKTALKNGIVVGQFGSGDDVVQLVLREREDTGGPQDSAKVSGSLAPGGGAGSAGTARKKETDKVVGPLFAGQETSTAGAALWAIWLFAALGVVGTVRAFYLERRDFTRDSPAFLKALDIWQPWIQARQETPRAIKRYLNRVRFIALRLRGRFPEAGTVALSAIYYLHPDWLRNTERYEMVLGGKLGSFMVDDLQLDVKLPAAKVQADQLAELLSASPRKHAEWAATAEDDEQGREAAWPPTPEHRVELLRVLADTTLESSLSS